MVNARSIVIAVRGTLLGWAKTGDFGSESWGGVLGFIPTALKPSVMDISGKESRPIAVLDTARSTQGPSGAPRCRWTLDGDGIGGNTQGTLF